MAAPQTVAAGPPEYGPAKGTLVIIGGNMRDNFGVPQKFIQLAGVLAGSVEAEAPFK